jgi:hypothetical protein
LIYKVIQVIIKIVILVNNKIIKVKYNKLVSKIINIFDRLIVRFKFKYQIKKKIKKKIEIEIKIKIFLKKIHVLYEILKIGIIFN